MPLVARYAAQVRRLVQTYPSRGGKLFYNEQRSGGCCVQGTLGKLSIDFFGYFGRDNRD